MLIDEFTTWIADQLMTDGNILLLGDFNMQTNRIDTNVDIKNFMDTHGSVRLTTVGGLWDTSSG